MATKYNIKEPICEYSTKRGCGLVPNGGRCIHNGDNTYCELYKFCKGEEITQKVKGIERIRKFAFEKEVVSQSI